MFRLTAVLLLSMASVLAHADEFEDADKAWADGKPWPTHWGRISYPYTEAWNVVILGFVNKIYGEGEAADTWLKHIPYARNKDASVEVCTMKAGLIKRAAFCKVGLVDPEIVGTLKEDDVVAFFYPNHGTKRFSSGPGSEARTTIRVFQKITSGDDNNCWERKGLVYIFPIAQACLQKVDVALVDRLLTRDFGPRSGLVSAKQIHAPVETQTETFSNGRKTEQDAANSEEIKMESVSAHMEREAPKLDSR